MTKRQLIKELKVRLDSLKVAAGHIAERTFANDVPNFVKEDYVSEIGSIQQTIETLENTIAYLEKN